MNPILMLAAAAVAAAPSFPAASPPPNRNLLCQPGSFCIAAPYAQAASVTMALAFNQPDPKADPVASARLGVKIALFYSDAVLMRPPSDLRAFPGVDGVLFVTKTSGCTELHCNYAFGFRPKAMGDVGDPIPIASTFTLDAELHDALVAAEKAIATPAGAPFATLFAIAAPPADSADSSPRCDGVFCVAAPYAHATDLRATMAVTPAAQPDPAVITQLGVSIGIFRGDAGVITKPSDLVALPDTKGTLYLTKASTCSALTCRYSYGFQPKAPPPPGSLASAIAVAGIDAHSELTINAQSHDALIAAEKAIAMPAGGPFATLYDFATASR